MPPAIRKSADSAGDILVQGSPDVFTNGKEQVRLGDKVKGHGKGPHSAPTMAVGSGNVLVNGKPAVRAGDAATCGHPAGMGSGNVLIN